MTRFILIISLLVFCGCASVNTIQTEFSKINYEDGVNVTEAKRIAQKFVMSHPTGRHFVISAVEMYWDIGGRFKDLSKSSWIIDFPSKELFLLSPYYQSVFIVAIDKKTGYLRLAAVYKSGAYIEFASYGPEGIKVE